MAEEPFMLVSLEEAKAKKLAQVLNNETCTKLLNHLAKHSEGTESDIAKKLKLPLSTVHYNLKQLVEAKLVLADEYHYSEKGREVNHYKLANKYIIIAPQEEQGGFLEKLKQFIPAALIVAGVGIVLKVMSLLTGTGSAKMTQLATPSIVAPMAEKSAFVEDAVAGSGAMPQAMNGTSGAGSNLLNESHPFLSNTLIWAFVIGGIFAIFLIALLTYLRKKKK